MLVWWNTQTSTEAELWHGGLLCKGPEAGMILAEASSWSGKEGAREEEATTRFGRVTDTVKSVSSFLLWNVRPRKMGPAGGG